MLGRLASLTAACGYGIMRLVKVEPWSAPMLPRNQRMELLSRAYVQALAANAGGVCVVPSPDYGIDFSIHQISCVDDRYCDEGSAKDIQLKSTTLSAFREDQNGFQYDLDLKAYNYLRRHPVQTIRLLILFVMPSNESLWLTQDAEGLLLRKCAYYLSLQGKAETKNKQSVRVFVPAQQVLTVEYLQQRFKERLSS
jgi:hypothetical protein